MTCCCRLWMLVWSSCCAQSPTGCLPTDTCRCVDTVCGVLGVLGVTLTSRLGYRRRRDWAPLPSSAHLHNQQIAVNNLGFQ
jgi:hypothetical protein